MGFYSVFFLKCMNCPQVQGEQIYLGMSKQYIIKFFLLFTLRKAKKSIEPLAIICTDSKLERGGGSQRLCSVRQV